MGNALYAIMRFAKYKGPEIGNIEAHIERLKELYLSNPDIDPSRAHLNFHLVEPQGKYRQEAERQIREADCRTRKDSVRVVEALFTASPDFFKGKKMSKIRAFFEEAMSFLKQEQAAKTILSAAVHMDEKTPHMHLCFVPLTEDNRLSAKTIVGNRKKLTEWQDKYWAHMVKKFPDLERGMTASETGRDHIPPRVFKEMTRLSKQREKLDEILGSVNPLNAKGKAAEIGKLLDGYIPAVAKMATILKRYKVAFTDMKEENAELRLEVDELNKELDTSKRGSVLKALGDAQLRRDYEAALAVLDRIPKEVLDIYTKTTQSKNYENEVKR